MTALYLKPKGEIPVRDPADPTAAPLPPEGKAVEATPYWYRRLADGDVEKTTVEAIAKGKAARLAEEAAKAKAAEAPAPAKPAKEK